jgi:hypothetical protein
LNPGVQVHHSKLNQKALDNINKNAITMRLPKKPAAKIHKAFMIVLTKSTLLGQYCFSFFSYISIKNN